MPKTHVVFFRDEEGAAPVFEALQAMLRQGKEKELAKCLVRIARLAEKGHELRRPEADVVKERAIPQREIERAIMNKEKFTADPGNHTFQGMGWR